MAEKIINKIRKDKKILRKLYKIVKSYIDMEADIINTESLQTLLMISKINEDLTDIIYYIIDNKNS